MATTLLISTFPPFPSLTLKLPSETRLADVPSHLPDFLPSFSEARLAFGLPSGSLPPDSATLSDLWDLTEYRRREGSEEEEGEDFSGHEVSERLISLRLAPRLLGGKGGFGSQLRAAGGRMSSQKTNNNDSCRDLNGRRLSTLKEAKSLAAYLESEPERKKAQQEAQRAKLEKLEKRLGISGKGKDKADDDVPIGVKRRFDDTEFLEESRDIVDNVKNAVAAGMLKKKKKTKTSPSPDSQGEKESSSASSSKTTGATKGPSNADNKISEDRPTMVTDATQKTLESPIASPSPAAAAASAPLAAIGA